MEWINLKDKLPDQEEVEIKLESGEVIDADWGQENKVFCYMGGQFYIAEEKTGFEEKNTSQGFYTGNKVTHWRKI